MDPTVSAPVNVREDAVRVFVMVVTAALASVERAASVRKDAVKLRNVQHAVSL